MRARPFFFCNIIQGFTDIVITPYHNMETAILQFSNYIEIIAAAMYNKYKEQGTTI